MSNVPRGGLSEFFKELRRRWRKPFNHATYLFYFLASIVLVGGLGIWLELLLLIRSDWTIDTNDLQTAINTFFPALIGSTCIQMIFSQCMKSLKGFSMLLMFLSTGVGIWLIADNSLSSRVAFSVGSCSTIISLWFWWIANADNADLFDDHTPSAPVGGDDPTGAISGSLGGLEV